jgi:hypothetical protein
VSQPPGRLIIVVPRHDPKLYAYLQRSFGQASNIEVVLDRRAGPAPGTPVTTPDLRRRSGTRRILGGLTIASAAPPPTDTAPAAAPAPPPAAAAGQPEPPAAPSGRPRLWPTLQPKDFTLIIPEADPNGEAR